MNFIVGVLTFFLVINCLVLILLVLVQLPKKDAGAGIAFGGGAADALFGAGSGNVLTKITKYATIVLLVLAVFLGFLEDRAHRAGSSSTFEKMVDQKLMEKPVAPSTAPQPATTPVPAANNLPAPTTPAPSTPNEAPAKK
jgi:preprotein translocase subunit SecG